MFSGLRLVSHSKRLKMIKGVVLNYVHEPKCVWLSVVACLV